MQSLASKYRPHTFADLVGQRPIQECLRRMVATNQVPSALLLDGSWGTGKTSTARILAAALNCDTPPGPCGHCPSCKAVFDDTSPAVIEIDAASNGLAEDMRQLCSQVMYQVSAGHRIVIIDEAQSASAQGFNVLLKTLEEPPLDTVFILLTTEPRRIPDTVVSRCMHFTFRRIAVADIAARLAHIVTAENLATEPALLHLIAQRAGGGLRDAVMALDQVNRAGITTVEAFIDLIGEPDFALTLLHQLGTGDIVAAYATLNEAMTRTGDAASITAALTAALKDTLILRGGADITATGTALAERQRLAQVIDTPLALAALRVLWDLKTKFRVGEDPRTALDLTVAMLAQTLVRPTRPSPAPAPAPAVPLSLAQMAAMRQ